MDKMLNAEQLGKRFTLAEIVLLYAGGQIPEKVALIASGLNRETLQARAHKVALRRAQAALGLK